MAKDIFDALDLPGIGCAGKFVRAGFKSWSGSKRVSPSKP